jgi:ornithine cyclodeaminase
VDVAANPGPVRLGLVGAGAQAWAQIWSVNAVRLIQDAVLMSRNSERTEAFARRARTELGIPMRPVSTAEEAVRDRDVVIVATSSPTPVLEAAWINPGTHLTTLGPKQGPSTKCHPS